VVENEDLVNFPNWLAFQFRIADADWFDARTLTILSYRQEFDLRLTRDAPTVRERDRGAAAINLEFKDKVVEFAAGGTRVVNLGRAGR
jgi:trehalose/maltose hydrolase-like predicted phosphorylase